MPPRVNIPPLTRGCLVACISLTVLTGALRYQDWMSRDTQPPNSGLQQYTIPYLTVVPALSIVFPWTFLTATLVEQNIFDFLITLGILLWGGKYLERAWGSAEFGKFLLVVALGPNVATFLIYIIWFALTGDLERSFATISGGVALQAGFQVAFKQLVPEHTITFFKGIVKIRMKHFPALFLLLHTLSGLLIGRDVQAILAWLGFFSSWSYLRFYKQSYADLSTSQAPSLKGDASETFAIAYFFPDPLHRPVAAVADVVYNVLIALKLHTPFSQADISAGNTRAEARGDASLNALLGGGGTRGAQPGTARAEAERRRALALKALDQRLHAAANKPPGGGGGGGSGSSPTGATAATVSSGNGVLGETSLDTNHQMGNS